MQPAFFSSVGILSFLIITTNASPLLQALSPRADAVIPGYTDEGCYTEATNMRALTGGTYFDDLMTVEKCAAACSGYTWFGVEYGRECYCGDTINTGSVPAPSTDCNFQCPGDATENCGAGNRLNMYSKASTAPATETLTTYSALGCYTEATTGRALVGLSQADNTMTVEQCASICSGFTTFGVEWYRECYCGNTFMPGSVPAPSTDCKYACDGNSSEICGGDWRLNVYQFNVVTNTVSATATASTAASTPTAYAFVDCYTEATNMRALSLSSYYDDAMTVEKCAAHCAAYTYFGVEYSRECYCGNSINSGSVPAPIGDCSFPCLGNGAEQCGGSNRLDLYQYGAVQSSTTPTLSTSTLLSSSSTSPSASTIVSSSSSQSESSAAPTSSAIPTPVSSSSASDIAATTSSTYLSSSSSIAITTSSTADVISSSSTTDLPTSSSSVYFSDSSGAAASSTLLSSSPSIISSSSSAALSSSSSIVESSSITQSSSPSSTFATSTSQSSSIVITSSSAMTTSTFSSTSSSTSSSTTSSTTTSGPTCATPLADAGFEATTAATVPWAVKYPATSNGYVTFNFQTPSTTTTPHGGSQVGAISYKQYSPALQSWFNQPITLCPNTVYNFSAFHKVSIVNPACNVYYYIGSADSNTVLTIFSSTAWSQVTTAWKQVTATYTSGSTTDVTFNIRLTCSTLTYAAPSYYFDDISFVAA